VTGVDMSPGMLVHAFAKQKALNLPIGFFEADMRSFSLGTQFPLITCLFDSLNHLLKKRGLLAAFRTVHAHLQPGGYFVFDVNNERCYKKIWRMKHENATRDFTLTLDCSYSAYRRRARADITLIRKHIHSQLPLTETTEQRCYSNREITDLLHLAGFAVAIREDFNFTDVPEVGKVKTWWAAKKP
jgi:SAM-dependent methyltransferase